MLYKPRLTDEDHGVVELIDDLRRKLRHRISGSPRRWQGLLRRVTFARNIRASNSIEGYNVTVDDALAAVEAEEALEATDENWNAVSGYRQAMTYVLQLAEDAHFTFSLDLLRSLHFMMLSYDLTKNPGKWRPGWVAVRDGATGGIVYEGPDADGVPDLMAELVDQLEAQAADQTTPDLVHAAMAHLNLVLIHPFSDGNGRMARCLQTLVLARTGVLSPVFSSIEEYLGHPRNTPAYYDVLAQVAEGRWSPRNDTNPWIRFNLTAHYRQAYTYLTRTRSYEKLWAVLEEDVKARDLQDRVILALWDAAIGLKVRNATYRSAAEVSANLASRDLAKLVDEKLLEPRGRKRGRYYVASKTLEQLFDRGGAGAEIPDPYELLDGGQATLPGVDPNANEETEH